jgi:hypothetical protein
MDRAISNRPSMPHSSKIGRDHLKKTAAHRLQRFPGKLLGFSPVSRGRRLEDRRPHIFLPGRDLFALASLMPCQFALRGVGCCFVNGCRIPKGPSDWIAKTLIVPPFSISFHLPDASEMRPYLKMDASECPAACCGAPGSRSGQEEAERAEDQEILFIRDHSCPFVVQFFSKEFQCPQPMARLKSPSIAPPSLSSVSSCEKTLLSTPQPSSAPPPLFPRPLRL